MAHLRKCCLAVLSVSLTAGLSGCALTDTATSTRVTAPAIKGTVFGGQQPIAGAHVYVYAANTAGYYNATSPSTYSSISLLQAGPGITADGNGNFYVTTSPIYGSFSISGDYSCTPGQEVYLYAVGGDSGSGNNSAVGLMALLGDCPSAGNFATATPNVIMNEVSTVASAYAMAGFAFDATHVSSPNNALALTGIKNAFANAANLANLATGFAYATTPAGNGVVPQATIYTLANILAACINSVGPGSPTCSTLFSNAQNAGTAPSDTATAAINIAHNPGANVGALYQLPTATSPFPHPSLASQPNDFTLGVTYTGGGLSSPRGIAVDGSGNLWVANTNSSGGSAVEFSSTGAVLSQTSTGAGSLPISIAVDISGNAWLVDYANNSLIEVPYAGGTVNTYTGGGMVQPWAVAIDGTSNVWVASNGSPSTVTKFSSGGTLLSGPSGYAVGYVNGPLGIAIDGSGDAWLPDSNPPTNVVKISSTGTVLSPANGYPSSGFTNIPKGIAIDSLGDVWIPSTTSFTTSPPLPPSNPPSLFELSNSGGFLSPGDGYTGAGITAPYFGVALDGAGDVWVANTNYSVSEFTNGGAAISPSTGYTGGAQGFGWGIAIDGSGDTWVANYDKGSITELIGVATPVITPICAGLPVLPTSNGTSTLGTRP